MPPYSDPASPNIALPQMPGCPNLLGRGTVSQTCRPEPDQLNGLRVEGAHCPKSF